jgi:hypothetical protein
VTINITLLLGNDVAENPGPETKVGEVSVFHWNSRCIRHKLDHLQTISNDSSIICVTAKLTLLH